MKRLWVNYTQKQINCNEDDEDHSDYDYSVDSVTLSQIRSGWSSDEYCVPFNVIEGDDVFVVYAIYSGGDSQSSYTGCGEIIDVFNDKDYAEYCVCVVEETPEEQYSITYPITNYYNRTIENMFAGYNTFLTKVRIKQLKVER